MYYYVLPRITTIHFSYFCNLPMFSKEINIRVRYSETDQMGFVYYGDYAQYFEVGRTESLRHIGLSYFELEKNGILLPVADYKCKFLKPAKYDDMLRVITDINILPTAKIHFEYKLFNQENELLALADTTLVFIKKENGKPCRAPEYFLNLIRPYFE